MIKTWIFIYTLTTEAYGTVQYVWRVHQNNLKTSKLYRAPRFINSWIRHWRRNPKVYVGLENDLYCILSILLPEGCTSFGILCSLYISLVLLVDAM